MNEMKAFVLIFYMY